VLPSVVADPAESTRMLQHERTHFDLTEVHARRMRRYFSQIMHPCTRPHEELQAAVTQFISAEAEAQARYDKETSYGRVAARQSAWNSDVAQLLLTFDEFKR
jgi:predicted secreted Zn-dependent protease